MLWTILKYIPLAVIYVVTRILAFPVAYVASLPCFITYDANGREHIHPFWQWITTHDALIDIYIYAPGGREHPVLKKYTVEQIKDSKWLRYRARIFWIWRNPAYQVGHWFGYDQKGAKLTKHAESETTWDKGVPSYAYWTAVNEAGTKAFLWEKQVYYWGQRCLEMQFGWKLYRSDPDEICMLAFRCHPFKRYQKIPAVAVG